MSLYSRILGTGSFLPPKRLSNAELAAELAQQGVETSDDWIVERTGIRARHFAAPDVACSDLATEAARQALAAAQIPASELDLIIVATSTPDMVFPSTATMVQHKLGAAGCPAFDVQAVCSGFIYALTVADAMVRAGGAKKALVIGSEVFSRILDFKDRTTCVLFGDGAGAVVLEGMWAQQSAKIEIEEVALIINGNEAACHNRNKVRGSSLAIETVELYRFDNGTLTVRYFVRQP